MQVVKNKPQGNREPEKYNITINTISVDGLAMQGVRVLATMILVFYMLLHIDGLVQDCSISIANALEILQSHTKPSIYMYSKVPAGMVNPFQAETTLFWDNLVNTMTANDLAPGITAMTIMTMALYTMHDNLVLAFHKDGF